MTAIRDFVRISSRTPGALAPTMARQLTAMLAGLRQRYDDAALAQAFEVLRSHIADHHLPHGTDGIGGGSDGLLNALYKEYLALTPQPISKQAFRTAYVGNGRQQLELMRRLCLNRLGWVEGYGATGVLTPYHPALVDETPPPEPCWVVGPDNPFTTGTPCRTQVAGQPYYQPTVLGTGPYPFFTLVFKLAFGAAVGYHQPILAMSNGRDEFHLTKVAMRADAVSAELTADTSMLTAPTNILVALLDAYASGEAAGITDFRGQTNEEVDVVDRITQWLTGTPTAPSDQVMLGEWSYGGRDDQLLAPTLPTADHDRVLSYRPPTASLEEGVGVVTVSRTAVSLYYLYRGGLSRVYAPSYGLASPPISLTVGLPLGPGAGDRLLGARLYPTVLTPAALHQALCSL